MKKQLKEQTKVKGILESYKPSKIQDGPVLGTYIARGIVGENKVSKNGTYYETKLWEQSTAFGKGGKFFDEKGNLRPATLLGSLDHPVGQAEMRFENSAIAWKRIWKENDEWCGEVDILNTPAGRIVKTHLDYAKQTGGGDMFGNSLRALGEGEEVYAQNESYTRIIPETFELMAIDFVYDPSFSNKATLTESTKTRQVLVEQVNRLAEQDVEHAKIYKAYAQLLKRQNPAIKAEAKAVDTAKANYIKTLKAEQNKLVNLIYELENMSEEDFKAKYKNKNFKKVLEHFKAEKDGVDKELEKLANTTMESTKGDNMGNKKNINEATDLDKALEELGEELDVAEQEEVEADEAEVTEEEEVAEDVEAEVTEAEEGLEEPTLASVMDALNDLRAMVEELKMQLAPVEPFTDEAEDLDVDIELADEEEEADEEEADAEVAEEDLDELDEDDFENMTDEELLAMLEDI